MAKPFVMVVTGRPGSGKTTLAHKLARRIHCPVLSRDELKEGYVHTMGGTHESLGKDVNWRLYDIFFESIKQVVVNRISLIIEAAFQHKLWKPKLIPLAENANISIVVCSVDTHVARSRLIERGLADPSRDRFHGDKAVHAAKEGHDLQVGNYVPPKLDFPTLTVDTSDGYNPMLDEIADFLLESVSIKQDGESGTQRGAGKL